MAFTNRMSAPFQILVRKKLESSDTFLHLEAIFLNIVACYGFEHVRAGLANLCLLISHVDVLYTVADFVPCA